MATDIPGCREIVRDGQNGYLVRPRSPHDLARALDALLGDRALQARLGAAGRQIAVDEFSLDRIIRETLDLYGELSGSHDVARASATPRASA